MHAEATSDGISFINWLITNKGLKERSAKDVYSRYNRALRFTEINPCSDREDVIYYLSKCDEFKTLSVSVKSQIKRAIRFYLEFCNGNK